MSYKLNKTDGSLLVELVDGRLDTTSADINLIGKNYQGFGESINENFIKLLENFSNSSAPSKPLKGQLWFDSSTGRLKVYTGATFKSTDSTIFASSQPTDLVQGDIWIDGANDQLYFWNGSEKILVGPRYTKNQLRTGPIVETIKDTIGQNKIVVKNYINGSLISIEAKENFSPFPAITGFDSLKKGINVNSAFPDYQFYGIASTARELVDELGNVFNQDNFLSADSDDVTEGKLTVRNDRGFIVGDDLDLALSISGETVLIATTKTSNDLKIQLKDSSGVYTAQFFDNTNKRIGIYNEAPDDDFVIGTEADPKNLKVTGDLTVLGDRVALEIETLRVQDFQIELAVTDDSTPLPDGATIDGAGIVVKVDGGDDKSITWSYANDTWELSHSIDLPKDTLSYKIDNAVVLTKTALGPGVTSAPGLQTIGTLGSLTIDQLTLDDNRLTSSTTLELYAGGVIEVNNLVTGSPKAVSQREDDIGIGTRSSGGTLANIDFVEAELAASPIFMGLNTTGMGSGATLQNNVRTVMEEINPVVVATVQVVPNGTVATLYCTAMTAETQEITISTRASTDPDAGETIVKTFIAVDAGGTLNEPVLDDFAIGTQPNDIAVDITVTRTIMVYKVISGAWAYVSTTLSTV